MTSNLISMAIYGTGMIIGLITILPAYGGLIDRSIKGVPIPSHAVMKNGGGEVEQLIKVIRGWLYSPLGHFVLPVGFIVGFFRRAPKNYLKKNLKLTILSSLILPTTYFLYCYLRSRLGDKTYFKNFAARGPYFFLSSKTMMKKLLGINSFRFVWKVILVLFGFSLFAGITYFSLLRSEKIKKILSGKSTEMDRQKKKKKTLFLLKD